MNTLKSGSRSGNWTRKALIALLLCSFLFQVQTVFACQMMDHSGPVEQCCCDDMALPKAEPVCCDIHTELTVKAVDADKDEPVALSSQPSLDPPPATLVFLLTTLWPDAVQTSPSPVTRDLAANPAHPGTQTWLTTLRLRI